MGWVKGNIERLKKEMNPIVEPNWLAIYMKIWLKVLIALISSW